MKMGVFSTSTTRSSSGMAGVACLVLIASSLLMYSVEGGVSDDPNYTDMTSFDDDNGNPVHVYYRLDMLDEKMLPSGVVTRSASGDVNAVSMKMVLEGTSWLGLGMNPDGEMIGGEVMIGCPDGSDSNGGTNPGLYGPMTKEKSRGVVEMAEQNFVDASIVEDGTTTTLIFTRALDDGGTLTFDPKAVQTFIWAAGPTPYPSYHSIGRGKFDIDWTSVVRPKLITTSLATPSARNATGGILNGTVNGGGPATNSRSIVGEGSAGANPINICIAHGIMAVIAWAFLAPMAVAASTLRDLFPKGPMWFKIHITFNITATLLTVATFLVAVIYNGAEFDDPHFVGGWVIFFGVLVQASLGAVRPKVNPDAKDGPKAWWEQISLGRKRAYFEVIHNTMGWSMLGLTMWQMYTGLLLMTGEYGTTDYTTAYWGWMTAFWVVVGVAKLFVWCRAKTQESVFEGEEKRVSIENKDDDKEAEKKQEQARNEITAEESA
jgi:hypothetical protein